MKKFTILTLISFLVFSIHSNAQIKKGTILLGGGLGFNLTESGSSPNETSFSGFHITPSVGFVTKDNQAIGFNLFYSHASTVVSGSPYDDVKNNAYGGGVFLRRYLPVGKNFYMFGEGQANFNYSQQTSRPNTDLQSKIMIYNGGISLYPGLAYAVNKRFHLELGLNNLVSFGYNRQEVENVTLGGTTRTKSSGFQFSTNLSTSTPFNVGFRVGLGK